MEDRHNLSVL